MAALYVGFLLVVRGAEQAVPDLGDLTFPVYGVLAAVYLLGAVLLAALGRRVLYAVGAVVQVVVLGLFVVFGVGLLGPGVFDYEVLDDVPVAAWAVAISSLQVALLLVLVHLAAGKPATSVRASGADESG